MATDSHRKHHRSPSDNDSPDSPKRHKHHRHRRHHRRHRSTHHDREKNDEITTPENKHNEQEQEEEEVIATKKPVLVDYDDMEEGEIIEDDDGGGGGGNLAVEGQLIDVKKAGQDSDVESGEFKAGDGPTSDFDDSHMSIDAATSKKSSRSDQSDEGKEGSPVLERIANGDHDSRSSKGGSRSHSRHKSLGKESGNGKERHRSTSTRDDDDDENDGDKRSSHLHSHARNHAKIASDTIRSESLDRRRERSQSILHDRYLKAHESDEGRYGNGKAVYEVDDERNNRSGRYYKDYSGENIRDIGTERGSSKERSERYFDRDWEKERHSYRSKDREREKDSIRYRERSRETNCDVDHGRNRNGSRDRDLDRERDRRREKDSGRSRDRDFDRERRRDDSVSMYRDKDKDWDRSRENGRDKYSHGDRHRDKDRDSVDYRRRYHKYDERENGYGNRDSRRSYVDAEYDSHTRTKLDPEKHEASKVDSQKKKDGDKDDDDQNEYQESVELKPIEQEEEDVDRIKEESRKRREAILQKFKAKQSQHQQEQHQPIPMVPKVSDEQLMEQPSQNLASVNLFKEEINGTKNIGKPSMVTDIVGDEGRTVMLGEGSPKSEKSNDIFCDDIFGESPAGVRKTGKGDGVHLERSGLHDNWDDPEGYYSFRFGEILDGRYEITAPHGKGVFSTVVRAKDLKPGTGDPEAVAIKIIRNNETMLKAGTEELIILKKLVGADPEDRRHCVRYLSHFKYRNHLCIVFESLHMNLREVLKKFGRNIGLKLTAVRTYAKQLFIALKHLRNCGVLHCDIKPDNMLVNDSKNVLKLCDFGNAMFAGKNEITPYLVSRFYRAPEIILGLSYDHPMDIWSVGCCLYELYTGKVLFPGPTNNDMLRLHMELKGHFPKKMLRKGAFIEQHFDQDLNFLAVEEDPVTKKAIRRLLVNIKPKDIGNIIRGSAGEDPKMLANFKDLLDKIFVLDPDKRLTVSQALNHPFITGK